MVEHVSILSAEGKQPLEDYKVLFLLHRVLLQPSDTLIQYRSIEGEEQLSDIWNSLPISGGLC